MLVTTPKAHSQHSPVTSDVANPTVSKITLVRLDQPYHISQQHAAAFVAFTTFTNPYEVFYFCYAEQMTEMLLRGLTAPPMLKLCDAVLILSGCVIMSFCYKACCCKGCIISGILATPQLQSIQLLQLAAQFMLRCQTVVSHNRATIPSSCHLLDLFKSNTSSHPTSN